MNRKELENSILWNEGGGGFGLCSVANMMVWSLDCPTEDKPDLKSIVALGTPRNKYTKEELEKIVAFAKRKTADYDKMFRYRRGANLVIIDKCDRTTSSDTKPVYVWFRKRLSWEFGAMFSPTLDEALSVMEGK